MTRAVSGPASPRTTTANRIADYLALRRKRNALFADALFADPAWDIMLDLYLSASRGKKVYISDAYAAAMVPPTTARRWVNFLIEKSLVTQHPDISDLRKSYLVLTPAAERSIEEIWR